MDPVGTASAALFGLGSRIRGKRILHPHGVGFRGTLDVDAPGRYASADLLREQRTWRTVARLSRGIGLPDGVPDVLGLALRIEDAYGAQRHQDFLLVSSARGPVWQHLILPGPRGFLGHAYSSVLLYRIGTGLRVVGAEPRDGAGRRVRLPDLRDSQHAGLSFNLTLAMLGGRTDTVARLELGARIDDAVTEALAFNPWNCGGSIRPSGPFMGLRRPSYVGSQAGRGAQPQGREIEESSSRPASAVPAA